MPGFNGLGPMNSGSMTGKGRGYCILELEPNTSYTFAGGRGMGRGMGRGLGRGVTLGRGRGMNCRGRFVVNNPQMEEALLRERQEFLQQELNLIEKHLNTKSLKD